MLTVETPSQSEMEKEVHKWPSFHQGVSNIDWSIRRVFHVKNPEGMPQAAENLRASRWFGWWDPPLDRWFFFSDYTQNFDSIFETGLFELDLPQDFDGSSLLEFSSYREEISFVVGRAGGSQFGALLRQAKFADLTSIPRHILPFAKINRAERLQLRAVLYLKRKLVALWEQNSRSVGYTLIPSLSGMRGVVDFAGKGLAVSAANTYAIKKFDTQLEAVLGQTWRKEKLVQLQVGLEDLPVDRRNSSVRSFWSAKDGFLFFGDRPDKHDPGEIPLYRFTGTPPPALNFAKPLFGISLARDKVVTTFSRVVGPVIRATTPRLNFPLQAKYAVSAADFQWKEGDHVLCVFGNSQGNAFALIGREDGSPMGWEACMSVSDAGPGGWLMVPHRRMFLGPQMELEETINAFKFYAAKALHF